MKTIWKFHVPVDSHIAVMMPEGAEVLSVQVQPGQPQVWAVVDPEAPLMPRTFFWRGTGHAMGAAEGCRYVGTIQVASGDLVFHLFEQRA